MDKNGTELHLDAHTRDGNKMYLTPAFISSQTQGNKWSRSTQTSKCVFLWEWSPIKLKPCTRFTCIFHYSSFRLAQLPEPTSCTLSSGEAPYLASAE